MTSTATKYTTPIFNLNGTSRETVLDELYEARAFLSNAIEALRAVTCHPRDFQFSPAGSWNQAHFEKSEAIANLDSALDWVDAWLTSAEEQGS
tara:strand:+ start:1486 stop:1764 length:279 start_codon:yes stop_codon:yes gene_type:complete